MFFNSYPKWYSQALFWRYIKCISLFSFSTRYLLQQLFVLSFEVAGMKATFLAPPPKKKQKNSAMFETWVEKKYFTRFSELVTTEKQKNEEIRLRNAIRKFDAFGNIGLVLALVLWTPYVVSITFFLKHFFFQLYSLWTKITSLGITLFKIFFQPINLLGGVGGGGSRRAWKLTNNTES